MPEFLIPCKKYAYASYEGSCMLAKVKITNIHHRVVKILEQTTN